MGTTELKAVDQIETKVIFTRDGVSLEQAAEEVYAYVCDHDDADAMDLFEALELPMALIEQALDLLISQGKMHPYL